MSFTAICTTETLTDYLDYIDALVDETRVNLTPDGLTSTVVDPANVAMVDITLDAEAFESYEADGGMIAFNIGRLQDMLSVADKGDLVHLDLDDQTRKLEVRAGAVDYSLALLDPDTVRDEPEMPTIDDTEFVVEGRTILLADTAAGNLADNKRITFGYDALDEVFTVDAQGDTDDMDIAIDRDDLVAVRQAEAGGRTMLSLDYVDAVCKPLPKDVDVTVSLAEDMPLILAFEDEQCAVRYMLAPRIAGD